ncbi:MAG: DUF2520 domain-containing protein [Gemmatimonadota bacterium]|nr:MAG: DUF2520 domain-containing protein [Gemmatimonadota bacterium]
MAAPFWIIGPGRMGLSLGSVVAQAGLASELLFVGRRERRPEHQAIGDARYSVGLPGRPAAQTRVLLAVPDGAIAETARLLAELGTPGEGCVALHHSGAQTAQILAPLAERGYATGSLHPLQSVADARHGVERLRGAYFTFEGDERARAVAIELVKAAGGRMLELRSGDKARYHAACVFASNYVVACAGTATQLLAEASGVGEEEALQALMPLWRGAVANLEEAGLPKALTGPVARGDLATVRRHLAALDGDTRDLYRHLALRALELSRRLGLGREVADAIEAEIRASEIGGRERR